jgi:hypothetical protein
MHRQITCIIINARPVDCTCIAYVGTVDSEYLIPASQVVKLIESGKDRFYLLDFKGQDKLYVSVAQRGDLKYIRTQNNDSSNDSLLKVSNCNVTDNTNPPQRMGDLL